MHILTRSKKCAGRGWEINTPKQIFELFLWNAIGHVDADRLAFRNALYDASLFGSHYAHTFYETDALHPESIPDHVREA